MEPLLGRDGRGLETLAIGVLLLGLALNMEIRESELGHRVVGMCLKFLMRFNGQRLGLQLPFER